MTIARTLDAIHKVGDPVWIFDANHRVYTKDKSGPVWREHWRKREVTAETSRSWIVGEGWAQTKIPKKGPKPWGVCWTEEEIDRRAYVEGHAVPIADQVRRINDYDLLKKVADLIGYTK